MKNANKIVIRVKDKKTGLFSPTWRTYPDIQSAQDDYIKNMFFGSYSTDILLFKVADEREEIKMSDKAIETLKNGGQLDPKEPISSFSEVELCVPEDITPYEDVDYMVALYQRYGRFLNRKEVENDRR